MQDSQKYALVWFRRDLRLADNPALVAALSSGAKVVPIFIADQTVAAMGAACKWRLSLSLKQLALDLAALGSKLIIREGDAAEVLNDAINELNASALFYNRDYSQPAIERDSAIKADLSERGIDVQSFNAALLQEPWQVKTGAGSYFKVYTPFWKATRACDIAAPLPAPQDLAPPSVWPNSLTLEALNLERAMNRGGAVVLAHTCVGEAKARARLTDFVDEKLTNYAANRDRMDIDATSRLSENLAYGEISPRTIWFAGMRALEDGNPGAEKFLKELVWRDFAYHLTYHTPHIAHSNWRTNWDGFPWRQEAAEIAAWQQGQTGEPIVDAAMRELYVTGTMHNRARMIVASYLTKHLLVDWRVGQDWFAECLIDWDPAANAMGWQWVAGSGPDAAPYFRIFNPRLQAEKFDPQKSYQDHYLRGQGAEEFARAIPKSWGATNPPRTPICDLKQGRDRALAAYQHLKS